MSPDAIAEEALLTISRWQREQVEKGITMNAMTTEKMEEIARGNIERHLGDCCENPDDIYHNAYTLAFDALHDAGVDDNKAGEIAQRIAMCFAQQ